jgi:hypothetical protein
MGSNPIFGTTIGSFAAASHRRIVAYDRGQPDGPGANRRPSGKAPTR